MIIAGFAVMGWLNKAAEEEDIETPTEREKRLFLEAYPDYGYRGRIDEIVATQLPHFKGLLKLLFSLTAFPRRRLPRLHRVRGLPAVSAREGLPQHGRKPLWQFPLVCTRIPFCPTEPYALRINPSSIRTDTVLREARDLILKWFNVDSRTHTVIFTPGTTGALKIVV